MTNSIDSHVGSRIRAARIARDMTQTDVALALNISFQQVQKYEKGTNRISASRLWDMADLLQVPIADFFDGLDTDAALVVPDLNNEGLIAARSIEGITDPDVRARIEDLIIALSRQAR